MYTITFEIIYKSWTLFWLVYWGFGILITWLSREKREIINLGEVVLVLITNMFWTLIALLAVSLFPLRMMTNYNILFKIIGTYLFTDIYFYHFHIMLHSPKLYKFHKMHHEFKYPYALTGLYCSVYETVFLNVFATAIGPIIFQMETPYLYLWIFTVSLNTVLTHSGNNIPFLVNDSHDKHHHTFNHNYGISPIFDYIYGTLKIDY